MVYIAVAVACDVLPVPTGWTKPEPGALRPAVLRFTTAVIADTGTLFAVWNVRP